MTDETNADAPSTLTFDITVQVTDPAAPGGKPQYRLFFPGQDGSGPNPEPVVIDPEHWHDTRYVLMRELEEATARAVAQDAQTELETEDDLPPDLTERALALDRFAQMVATQDKGDEQEQRLSALERLTEGLKSENRDLYRRLASDSTGARLSAHNESIAALTKRVAGLEGQLKTLTALVELGFEERDQRIEQIKHHIEGRDQ